MQGSLQGSFGCKKLRKYIIVFSSYFSILSLAPLSTAPLDSKALARYLARHLCMAKSRGRFVGGKSFQVPCFETPTRVPFFSRGGASKLYFACRPLSLLLTCSECPPPALISCCWDTLSVVPLILFLFDTGFISLSHSKGSFWGNEDNACHHPTRLQGDIHINFNA